MARTAIQNANASLYFNGAAYADTSSNSTLALANGFTVAGWMKVSKFITVSTRQKMISTSNWGFGVTSTTQKLSFTTLGVLDYDSTGLSISPGNWFFACVVFNSSNDANFYLNGVLDSVVAGTNPANTTASVTSLGRRPLPSDLHIGNLSKVRVWNTELTAAQISALYTTNTVPSGLIAEYLLNEGAGSIAYDSSGNGNNGTITSGTWTRDAPSKTRTGVNGNLVYNGDFEIAPVGTTATTTGDRWIDGTAGGTSILNDRIFGWGFWNYTGSYAAKIDTSVKYSGTASMKVSTTATGSTAGVRVGLSGYTNLRQMLIPILPSTSYTYSVWIKTNLVSGSATTGARCQFAASTGALGTGATTSVATGLVATQDWTQYTGTFTTAATERYITPSLQIVGNDGAGTLIMDAWFDDITLTPTTDTTRTATTGPYRKTVANLVANGDFEYAPSFTAATNTASRWIDGTAAGSSATSSQYDWAIPAGGISTLGNVQYDTTVSYSGNNSIKLTTLDSTCLVVAGKYISLGTASSKSIPCLPSTSYTFSAMVKTSGGGYLGAYLRIRDLTGSGSAITTNSSSSLLGVNEWTRLSITFTTGATAQFLAPIVVFDPNVAAFAWFDDIVLTKTTPDARTIA